MIHLVVVDQVEAVTVANSIGRHDCTRHVLKGNLLPSLTVLLHEWVKPLPAFMPAGGRPPFLPSAIPANSLCGLATCRFEFPWQPGVWIIKHGGAEMKRHRRHCSRCDERATRSYYSGASESPRPPTQTTHAATAARDTATEISESDTLRRLDDTASMTAVCEYK